VIAEQDIRMNAWYFQCHMPETPCNRVAFVSMPSGNYLVSIVSAAALWVLDGLLVVQCYVQWSDSPFNKCVRYEVDIRRYSRLKESGASLGIGDGRIYVDDELIATVIRRGQEFLGILLTGIIHCGRKILSVESWKGN